MTTIETRIPGKLGLALAGGGFRASLFHLGVLRRLAELDLLRRVELLSTVSGGSIIGILYVLLLKKYLERSATGNLSRAEYVALVQELDNILLSGIRKNLRARLTLNPLGLLLPLLTSDSLSRRMGRIYERYLLEPIVRELEPNRPWWKPLLMPGRLPLKSLVIHPGRQSVEGGLDSYNAGRRAEGGSVVTAIIINATTLNSGGRFFFTAVELGDWYLGTFRAQEIEQLLDRKRLLQAMSDEDLAKEVTRRGAEHTDGGRSHRIASLAQWWRARRRGDPLALAPAGWEALFGVPGFPGELETVALGQLRSIKVAAWYLLEGPRFKVDGGRSPAQHWATIAEGLREIDPDLRLEIPQWGPGGTGHTLLLEFLLELNHLRAAERVSWGVEADWNRLRVGHAMGASACFPPVFPPYLIYGIYDDLHVARLGLTDGGVYDNTGITALIDEGCDTIIGSDTGGTFRELSRSPAGRAGLALRIPEILMRVVGGTQRAALRERRRVTRALGDVLPPPRDKWSEAQLALDSFRSARRLDDLAYFHIDSARVAPPDDGPPPLELPVQPQLVATLRTDLDGFGELEIAVLVNHGYDMADRYVRRYLTNLGDPDSWRQAPPHPPKVMPASAEHLEKVLLAGRSRFFRALALRAPVAWAFTIVAVAVATVALARSGLALSDALSWVGAAVVGVPRQILDSLFGGVTALLHRVVPAVPDLTSPPVSERPFFLAAMVAVASAWFLFSRARRPRDELRTGAKASVLRRLIWVGKWVRAFSGNALWLAWALPALVAGAASVIAAVSYVFYYLPFMRATRVQLRDD